MNDPWRITDLGLEVTVRLTPKGGRDQIDGVGQDPSGRPALLVRVAAPPRDGAANKALVKMMAKTAGIPKSKVTLISGETSRVKRLLFRGNGQKIAATLCLLQ